MSGYRATDKRVDDLLDEVARLKLENDRLVAMIAADYVGAVDMEDSS